MALEQCFEESRARINSLEDVKSSIGNWKTVTDSVSESKTNASAGFDCNICLDGVQEPVVTLCGHLYCWPCIYKWIQLQSIYSETQEKQPPQCPVCKTEVSETSLVPLYVHGQSSKSSKGKVSHLGIVVPRRPTGPSCGLDSPRTYSPRASPQPSPAQFHNHHHPHQSQVLNFVPGTYTSPTLTSGGLSTSLFDPVIGIFGEMIYARVFGNSVTNMYTYRDTYNLAGSSSPRLRRHVMQADKSLSRICFFLFCCLVLCLLLF